MPSPIRSIVRRAADDSRAQVAALLLLPAFLAIAINVPAITRSFQGDDFAILVRHRQDGLEFVFNAFRELHIGAYYRPVLDLSFFFQQKAFDDAAVAWHVVSVLFHSGSAAFLGLAMFAMTRRVLPSALAGFLFALSPTYAGGVAWIANQSEVVAGMFSILALALFVFATREKFNPDLYWASVAVFALALGSKEVAITVLAPIVAYSMIRAGEQGRRSWESRELLPFVAVAGVFAAAQLTRLALGPEPFQQYHLGLHVFDTTRYLLWRLLLPLPANYTGVDALSGGWLGMNSALAYAAVGSLTALLVLAYVRGTTAMRVMLVWLVAAVLLNAFWETPFSSARYAYVPALAFSGVAAEGLSRVFGVAAGRVRWAPPVAIALVLSLGAAFAFGTLDQSRAVIDEGGREERLRSQLEALNLDITLGTAIYLLDYPRIGNFGLFDRSSSLAQSIYGPSVGLRALPAGKAEEAGRNEEGPVLYLPTVDETIVEASRWGRNPWQPSPLFASDEQPVELPAGYRIERVLGGLNLPTQLVAGPEDQLFIAEQGGTVRVVVGDALQSEPIVSVDVSLARGASLAGWIHTASGDLVRAELGLTGLAIDPAFESRPYLYIYYTAKRSTGDEPRRTVLARVTLEDGQPVRVEELLGWEASFECCRSGGGMAFAPDGTLLVAVGDHEQPFDAQNVLAPPGSILRLSSDGTAPFDNPFRGPVFALGLRNPYDVAVDPATGNSYATENGFMGQDAVVEIKAGANFGWPGYGLPVPADEIAEPLTFHPSGSGTTGIEFYSAGVLAAFDGHILYCRRTTGNIHDIVLAANGTVGEHRVYSGPCQTDIATGPDGLLYFLDDLGTLYRIVAESADTAGG